MKWVGIFQVTNLRWLWRFHRTLSKKIVYWVLMVKKQKRIHLFDVFWVTVLLSGRIKNILNNEDVLSSTVAISLTRDWLLQSFSALFFNVLLFPWFVCRFGLHLFFHFECVIIEIESCKIFFQAILLLASFRTTEIILLFFLKHPSCYFSKRCLNGTVDLFTIRLLQ